MNIILKLLYSVFIISVSVTYFLPSEFIDNATSFMCLILGIAGFVRLSIYHPNYNMDYYVWIMNSPWKGEELPGGPARLVFNDGIHLSIFLGLSSIVLSSNLVAWPILSFLIFYNLAMLSTLDKTAIFLPLILLPFYYLAGGHQAFFISGLILVTASYQYLYLQDRKALFLKKESKVIPKRTFVLNPLLPNAKVEESSHLEKILLVIALISYAIATPKLLEELQVFSSTTVILFISISFSIVKLFSALKYGSCSGFIYRIKHFVLWDYKFDRIFFIPIIMLGTGILLSKVAILLNAPSIIAIPISTLIIATLGLFCGPNAQEWALTGKLQLYKPRHEKARL